MDGPPTQAEAALAPARQGRRRWLLFALGWVFFALGAVGVVLPGLPATPFMLLALWAFSASSRRFHDWLYHHRVFGPPLRRWREQRVIPAWVKGVAFGSMALSLAWVALSVRPPWYLFLAMVAVMLAGAVFIARAPSRPRPVPGSTPGAGPRAPVA